MIIPEALALKIADTARNLISCNVNIMDREGVIVGTAQPERLGTFHKGALDVVETGEAVEIAPDQVFRYPGALEGVNLPIVLDGQVIGVVGVTGQPDAVRSSARLMKVITELILERELIQQEVQSRQRLSEHLVGLLLWSAGEQERTRIARAAKALGVELETPRVVAVADVSGLLSGFSSLYGPSELVLERSTEAVLETLSGNGVTGPEDVAAVLDDKLVVLKVLDEAEIRRSLPRWGKRLFSALARVARTEVACGAGSLARRLGEYSLSYGQAMFCLRWGAARPAFRSILDHDMMVGYMLRETVSGSSRVALRPLIEDMRAAIARRPELLVTMKALAENNFESDMTAHSLGIHRNTLAYRLARLKEVVGLDPARRHDDAVLLRALLAAFPALGTRSGGRSDPSGASGAS